RARAERAGRRGRPRPLPEDDADRPPGAAGRDCRGDPLSRLGRCELRRGRRPRRRRRLDGTLSDDPEFRCRDAIVLAAPAARCFAPLVDLATYPRWWTLVRAEPLVGGPALVPGVRFRLTGARPSGPPVAWVVEVLEVAPPHRIELAYAEGDLLGRA